MATRLTLLAPMVLASAAVLAAQQPAPPRLEPLDATGRITSEGDVTALRRRYAAD